MKFFFTLLLIILSFKLSAQDCTFNDSIFGSILKTQNLNDTRLKAFSFDSVSKMISPFILDADNNGKISEVEAKKVYALFVSDGLNNNIKSLKGITCFSEMVKLSLTGLTIDSVSVNNTKLSVLHVIDNSRMRVLDASNSFLDTVIVASNIKLEKIVLNNNSDLSVLDCSNNDTLNGIEVNNCSNISVLSSINSAISNIDLTTNNSLRNLILKNNRLKKIAIKNNSVLQILILDDNPLDSIDILNLKELNTFSCNNTNVFNIDASQNVKLKVIDIANNLNLFSANLKNGSKLNEFYLSNVPNLRYICMDDEDTIAIIDSIKIHGNGKIEVNSYCTEKPGGYSNNIKGHLTFDSNGNGCDLSDTLATIYSKFSFSNAQKTEFSFVSKSNEVNFYSKSGSYNLIPIVDKNYFSVYPLSSNLSFMDSLNRDTTVNFCISSKNNFKDIEVLIIPLNTAMIGDTVFYDVLVRNKSSVTIDGTINFEYNDSLVYFLNSDFFKKLTNNKLKADVISLLPFESRKFPIVFKIMNKQEKPTISTNDSISYIASVNVNGMDVYTADNIISFNQPIFDSIRFNRITCLNGSGIQKNQPLNYLIDFDNRSKNTLTNTVIRQKIDTSKFEAKSVQFIQSSVPTKVRITNNNILYFIDNKSSEHKHGNILLRYQGLKIDGQSDTIVQKANIYFDNYSPTETNTEISTVKDKLFAEIKGITLDPTIQIFPNPSNGIFYLKAYKQIINVEVYDLNGRVLQTILVNDYIHKIDLSSQDTGIYLLKIITKSGANVLEIKKD